MASTTPATDSEWSTLISQTLTNLPKIDTSKYPAPEKPLLFIPKTIDHTQLSLAATEAQIDTLCSEAIKYAFATVCVRANYVPRAVSQLKGSDIGVACVIGFHEGTYSTAEKVAETEAAVRDGATELDMVINYPLLKEGKYTEVYDDVLAVRKASKPADASGAAVGLKVILETSQLSREQIVAGSLISCLAGADFVKTSTGFNGPGASVENVALMRAVCEAVRKGGKVKASGGVRTAEDCVKMIRAGAERIGASAGVKIVEETNRSHVLQSLKRAGINSNILPEMTEDLFGAMNSEVSRRWRTPMPRSKRKTTHDQPAKSNGGVEVDTSKPTAVFTPRGGRSHTLSIALPGSIIANAQSHEQKTFLVGSIARALAVFCVDEVVIFEDDARQMSRSNAYNNNHQNAHEDDYTAYSDPSHFLAHVLSYLETPPYLRKYLFPMHKNLRTAGTLPSLDMPHHIRANEWCEYREGVTVSADEEQGAGEYGDGHNAKKGKKKKEKKGQDAQQSHTLVNTGLPEKVCLPYIPVPENTRVTVKLGSSKDPSEGAEVVSPFAPREETGYYWGYTVRRCDSLSSVFTECPFEGGYDLSFGTSERGAPISDVISEGVPKSEHLLVVFGGVAGLEAAAKADKELQEKGVKPSEVENVFDYWVNVLPGQGSRTIRTEEAVWLGLMGLRPVVEANGS
ncbi:deoxyribose-phosphate aldolase [Helicocarpus griseus UAMH5409]|uniref:deoxyribose-phosphate aldolase n=1 Tax=Helicocarpus griseus UAMH5409 TaxID=1447875 RepID=A0A2B7XP73_9EURO|nr:deoxyribose-phosphate aldolase [Helicocarpus griseus UAMH5409]